MNERPRETKTFEFVSLMALLMSFVALAIDAMLPALGVIGADFAVSDPRDTQLVITTIFAGMGVGLGFYGPFSDAYGRKPAMYVGIALFLAGCAISWSSASLEWMLAGRLLQGLGAASSRVVTMAMIRDRFVGEEMAKVMSLIMVVFIMVPVAAPLVGKAILAVGDWRDIFAFMGALALAALAWLGARQPETLRPENTRPLEPSSIRQGIALTLANRAARRYTLASSLVFGAFVGYLSTSQPILEVQYGLGDDFPYAFGALALAIGASNAINSRLVQRVGVLNMIRRALVALVTLGAVFTAVSLSTDGHPPLAATMAFLAATFLMYGMIYGNLNTLAIAQLGHIAGVASSVIAAVQTILSTVFGAIIGRAYDGTVTPLVLGFLVLGALTLTLTFGSKAREDALSTLESAPAS